MSSARPFRYGHVVLERLFKDLALKARPERDIEFWEVLFQTVLPERMAFVPIRMFGLAQTYVGDRMFLEEEANNTMKR